jgi:hypothetical protein
LSKREQKDLRRLRREEAEFRARRKRFWLNVSVIGGAIVVALVVLGLVALSIHNRGGSGSTSPSTSTSPGATGTATGATTGTPSAPASGSPTAPASVPTTAAVTPTASGSAAQ